MNSTVIGIDIGGSHITTAAVDLGRKKIIENTVYRRAIDASGSAEHIISDWCDAITRCMELIGEQDIYIGIAMPGPFDYGEGICYIKEQPKYKSLYGVNVKKKLASALNITPYHIQFINDAVSYLRGEVFAGIAQNCNTVVGFTLGTGFGSSFYRDGQFEDADLWHYLFKEGIAEDYFSTRWFVNRYAEKTSIQVTGVKGLVEKYNDEPIVKDLFTEFGRNLADFIESISKEEKPEMIVLGGNISKSFHCFESALKGRLKNHDLNVIIGQSILNESAILLGAASCWLKEVM